MDLRPDFNNSSWYGFQAKENANELQLRTDNNGNLILFYLNDQSKQYSKVTFAELSTIPTYFVNGKLLASNIDFAGATISSSLLTGQLPGTSIDYTGATIPADILTGQLDDNFDLANVTVPASTITGTLALNTIPTSLLALSSVTTNQLSSAPSNILDNTAITGLSITYTLNQAENVKLTLSGKTIFNNLNNNEYHLTIWQDVVGVGGTIIMENEYGNGATQIHYPINMQVILQAQAPGTYTYLVSWRANSASGILNIEASATMPCQFSAQII